MKIKICGMRDPENIRAVASLPIDLMGFIFYEKSKRYVRSTSVPLVPAHVQRVGVFVNADIDFVLEKIKTHQLDYLQLHGDETPGYCRDIQTEITSTLKGEKNSLTLPIAISINEEPPAFFQHSSAIEVIKAFRVNEDFDFSETKKYEQYCAYFLFDTKKNINAVHPPAPPEASSGQAAKGRDFSQSEKQGANEYPPLEGAQGVEYGGTGKKFNWQILQQYTGNTPFLLSGGIGAEDAEAVRNFSHPQFVGIDLNSKFELEPALKDVSKLEDFLNELTR